MDQAVLEALYKHQIIGAIKNNRELERALNTPLELLFILYGDILSLPAIVEKVQRVGKKAIIHIDFIDGLAAHEVSVDYVQQVVKADGILSTKMNLLHRAKELGLFTVARFFFIDSFSWKQVDKALADTPFDCLEILPGAQPKIIEKLAKKTWVPIISGGLIEDPEDVMSVLRAGATAVSTSAVPLWRI